MFNNSNSQNEQQDRNPNNITTTRRRDWKQVKRDIDAEFASPTTNTATSAWKSMEKTYKIYQNENTAPRSSTNTNCAFSGDDSADIDIIQGIGACIVGALPVSRSSTLSLRQQLASTTTDWVTENLFMDPMNLRRYVSKFVEIYEIYVGSYVNEHRIHESVFLVFKGGNVIVDYIRSLSLSTDETKHFVKHSDIDFQVFVTSDQVYSTHISEIMRLIVQSAMQFKDYIRSNIQRLSSSELPDYSSILNPNPTPRYDPSQVFATKVSKKAWANNNNNNANDANDATVIDEFSASRACRMDAFILRQDSLLWYDIDKTNRRSGKIGKCQSVVIRTDSLLESVENTVFDNIYMTFNDSLRFKMKGAEGVASYDLVRVKYNVDIAIEGKKCPIHAPGELLDVSISTPNDFKMSYARDVPIDKWTFVMSDGVRVPSLDYITNHDLHGILFDEHIFPWEDVKYNKRLGRYVMCLALLDAGADKLPNQALYSFVGTQDANPTSYLFNENSEASKLNLLLQKVIDAMMISTTHKLNKVMYYIIDLISAESNGLEPDGMNTSTVPTTFQLYNNIENVKLRVKNNPSQKANFLLFLEHCLNEVIKTISAISLFAQAFSREKYNERNMVSSGGGKKKYLPKKSTNRRGSK